MTVRQILDTIGPEWADGLHKPGMGFTRQRWLQSLSDVISRPVANRVTGTTNATAVACTGSANILSTGVGTGAIIPGKYGETQVQARVTLQAGTTGVYQVYVYRTTGNIPANGSAPGVNDVAVGGDSFGGGSLTNGVNTPATLHITDPGLNSALSYKYYFAVSGPNAATLNLINSSQLIVSEF